MKQYSEYDPTLASQPAFQVEKYMDPLWFCVLKGDLSNGSKAALKKAILDTANRTRCLEAQPGQIIRGIVIGPEYALNNGQKILDLAAVEVLEEELTALSLENQGILLVPGTFRSRIQSKTDAVSQSRSFTLANSGQMNQVTPYQSALLATEQAVVAPLYGCGAGMSGLSTRSSDLLNKPNQSIDLLYNEAPIFLNGKKMATVKKAANWKEEELSDLDTRAAVFAGDIGSVVQNIEGINFGIEICLDHAVGRLDREVDVHIVLSDSTKSGPSKGVLFLHSSTDPRQCITAGKFGFMIIDPLYDLYYHPGLPVRR
jgi:predicted amidohydrolase